MEWYGLGELFAGTEQGVLTWIVRAMSEWWYGPVIGPAFSDSVLSGWQRYDPTQYVAPIA